MLHPGATIASDAMPWVRADGSLVESMNGQPLPEDAFAHPWTRAPASRSAATT
ncbi:hypothetical protein ACIQOW_18915 [Kitasatospora sp. NPDC091335]|uniref:hypothetical protein n=1 Tax=Kitasatospora sp. NPDC091335 TaxID=3364085 RepID=UPI0037F582A2